MSSEFALLDLGQLGTRGVQEFFEADVFAPWIREQPCFDQGRVWTILPVDTGTELATYPKLSLKRGIWDVVSRPVEQAEVDACSNLPLQWLTDLAARSNAPLIFDDCMYRNQTIEIDGQALQPLHERHYALGPGGLSVESVWEVFDSCGQPWGGGCILMDTSAHHLRAFLFPLFDQEAVGVWSAEAEVLPELRVITAGGTVS